MAVFPIHGSLVLIGIICGLLLAVYTYSHPAQNRPLWLELVTLTGLLLMLYIPARTQIIIHEAGHLLFRLLSEYTFSFFRIFSLMQLKENGRIELKRLNLVGTGGQCLMIAGGQIPDNFI